MKEKLISIWNWFGIITLVIVWTVLVSLIFLVTWPFDRVRRVAGRWFRRGGRLLASLNPLWKVEVGGYRKPRTAGPFVVISNHQSIADIPVLCHLPWEMKWLSKASNFKLPLFGWMMRMAGDIPLRRGDRDSASTALERCRWYLERGMSVMIFPEGTRSADEHISEFKDGAFRLAIETGRPILPVVIAGTRHCIPKNSWVFGGKSRIRVLVLEPVEVTGLTLQDVGRLRNRVRGEMIDAYERLGESLRGFREELPTPDLRSGVTS